MLRFSFVSVSRRVFSVSCRRMSGVTSNEVQVKCFFHKDTNTAQYVVHDEASNDAIVIDPVLDYEPVTGVTSSASAKEIVEYLRQNKFNLVGVFETHIHADHLSSADFFREQFGLKVHIGERIIDVQKVGAELFNVRDIPAPDDVFTLVKDGSQVGSVALPVSVIHTPGHTPACVTYVVGRTNPVLFVGDTVFMPDFGTARCDFPGGSATTLFRYVFISWSARRHSHFILCGVPDL